MVVMRMKTVVQISVDLILTEEQRDSDYMMAVQDAIERAEIEVAGVSFAEDMTDTYLKDGISF